MEQFILLNNKVTATFQLQQDGEVVDKQVTFASIAPAVDAHSVRSFVTAYSTLFDGTLADVHFTPKYFVE